jgi:hypothetical protein
MKNVFCSGFFKIVFSVFKKIFNAVAFFILLIPFFIAWLSVCKDLFARISDRLYEEQEYEKELKRQIKKDKKLVKVGA